MKEYLIKRIEGIPNWKDIPKLELDNVLWGSDDSIKANFHRPEDFGKMRFEA